jgi:death-on-curing family protein
MRDLRLAHAVLFEVFRNDPEPIPPWEQGELSKLETICGCTETGAFGQEKYPDACSKAAKLFYSAIKIHPFPNGNKRFALVLTITFFIRNDLRLVAPEGVGAESAKRVADSNPRAPESLPDVMVEALTEFFRENTEPRSAPTE